MKIITAPDAIQNYRSKNREKSFGLVPTMGFLHDGHLSLIRRARAENETVGVSLFVNPAQFNDQSDLENYPRNTEQDLNLLRDAGVDLVWMPREEDVYPDGFKTVVIVSELNSILEGASRPNHFDGVTTIVAKLFNVFQPDKAYFGQKDAQQVRIIQQLVLDLNYNLELIICPTVRERDGLAMSSRNANLSTEGRKQAACVYQALKYAKEHLQKGGDDIGLLKEMLTGMIHENSRATVDYISIASCDTLLEISTMEKDMLVSLAVYIDDVRLIDNMIVKMDSNSA